MRFNNSVMRGLTSGLCLLAWPWATTHADQLTAYLFSDQQAQVAAGNAHGIDTLRQSWLEDAEFRITPEQDSRGINNETYSLRFRPVSRAERVARKTLFDLRNATMELELEELRTTQLRDRYLQVINVAEKVALLDVARDVYAQAQRRVAAEEALTGSLDYEVARLQKALLAADARAEEVHRRESALQYLRRAAGIANLPLRAMRDGGRIGLTEQLPTPDSIESLMRAEILQGALLSMEYRLVHAELQEVRQEVALARAESRFGLNLLELSYEDKNTDSLNLTFGFRLPDRRGGYVAQKARRAYAGAQRKADLVTTLVNRDVHALQQEVYLHIDAFHSSQTLATRLAQREATDEVAFAALVANQQLDLAGTMIQQHAAVLRTFVNALSRAGLLNQRPLRNWLVGV